jgi:hypothetical protein
LRSERLRMRQNRHLIKFSHLAPLLCFPLHMATADVGYRLRCRERSPLVTKSFNRLVGAATNTRRAVG